MPITVLSIRFTICVSTNELVGGGEAADAVELLFEVRRENVVVSDDSVFEIGVRGLGEEPDAIAPLDDDVLPMDFFEAGVGDFDNEEREDEDGTSRECVEEDVLFNADSLATAAGAGD